jgi:hypothetical protein
MRGENQRPSLLQLRLKFTTTIHHKDHEKSKKADSIHLRELRGANHYFKEPSCQRI